MPLEVNNCCFFIGLRTGSLVIGYLNLIYNVVLTGLIIAGMVNAVEIGKAAANADDKLAAKIALAALGLTLVFMLLYMMFTIFLLVGVHKHKRGYVKAYLIFTCIYIVFAIIGVIASIAKGANASNVVQNLFSLLISIYYLIVIRSYYLKMDYTAPVGGE